MSYTTINGMRSARFPLQGLGITPRRSFPRTFRRPKGLLHPAFRQELRECKACLPAPTFVGLKERRQAMFGLGLTGGEALGTVVLIGAGVGLLWALRGPKRARRNRRR